MKTKPMLIEDVKGRRLIKMLDGRIGRTHGSRLGNWRMVDFAPTEVHAKIEAIPYGTLVGVFVTPEQKDGE